MKCFVIAMSGEANPIISAMQIKKDYIYCDKRVVCGTLYGEDVAVVVCGVGKVNAAIGAQYAIDCLGATVIINLGVAGGLNNSIKIAHMYAVSAVVQYDFDLVQINGTPIGTLNECTENYLPLSVAEGFEAKKVATGDRFNDSPEDYKLLTEVLRADIREMELGAIAQACMHAGVKCFSFKAISDLAGSGSTTEQFLNNLNICYSTITDNLEKIVKTTV